MKSKVKIPFFNATAFCPFIMAALGISGGIGFAAGTASDMASNYNGGGWGTTPPNNGSGFGAWNISLANANNPPYVGTYLDTGSAVAIAGNSWGIYANGSPGNGSITLTRPFTAGLSGSTSLYNQTFSFDLASGGVGPSQGLLTALIGNAFSLSYNGAGSDNFLFSVDGGTAVTVPIGYSSLNAGLAISLAVSGPVSSTSEAYTLTFSPFAGGSPLYSNSGTFDSSSFNTASFAFTDANTTGNSYLNGLNISPEVVPEPSSFALCGISGLAMLRLIRRR
jgi:hypothetical protein